jgi:hypothetical protein
LTDDDRIRELAYVLVRLEQAVAETAAGFRFGMTLVAALFFMMALAYGAAFSQWGVAAFVAAFGAGIVLIGRGASRKTAPEKMQPVLDAIRDAPDRITIVRHYQTSDSRRFFVTDWLEIKTADHRLIIKAKQDWQRLLETLRARCPNAKIHG